MDSLTEAIGMVVLSAFLIWAGLAAYDYSVYVVIDRYVKTECLK